MNPQPMILLYVSTTCNNNIPGHFPPVTYITRKSGQPWYKLCVLQ